MPIFSPRATERIIRAVKTVERIDLTRQPRPMFGSVGGAGAVGPFRATLTTELIYGSYTTATIAAPEQASWDGLIVTVYPDADWRTGDSRPAAAEVIITWFPGDRKWCASLRCNQLTPP